MNFSFLNSATATRSKLAPSTTFKSTHSSKNILAKLWPSSTSTAWWPESSQTSLMSNSLATVQLKSKWRTSSRLSAAPIQLKAASTWKTWERWRTSSKIHWRAFQPSLFASRSTQQSKRWLWLTSHRPFVRTFPSRCQPSAVLTHQQLPSLAASSLASSPSSPLACCNRANLPMCWK